MKGEIKFLPLWEGPRAGAGLSYTVHVDCCGLSTIVIKDVIIITTTKLDYSQ